MAKKKSSTAKKTTAASAKRKKPGATTTKKKSKLAKASRARRAPAKKRPDLGKAYHELFEAHAALQRAYIDELKGRTESMVEQGRKTARKDIDALEKKLKAYRNEYKRRAKEAKKMGEASWAETKHWFSEHTRQFDDVVKKLNKIKIT